MDRRTKIILAIVGVLVLIAVLLLLLQPRAAPPPVAGVASTVVPVPPNNLTRSGGIAVSSPAAEIATPPPPSSASTAIAVRQLAATFAERYGSFSSEGNFVNLVDLMPLMTERYRRDTETFVARERARRRGGEFSGTTSTIVRVDVTLPNGEGSTQASARVLLQRSDLRFGGSDVRSGGVRFYPQTLTLALVKVLEGWFVDTAVWEPLD